MWIRTTGKHGWSVTSLLPGYETVLNSNSRSWMQWLGGCILELELAFNADDTIYHSRDLGLHFVAWKIRTKYLPRKFILRIKWVNKCKRISTSYGKRESVHNWELITRVAAVVGREMEGRQQKGYENTIL